MAQLETVTNIPWTAHARLAAAFPLTRSEDFIASPMTRYEKCALFRYLEVPMGKSSSLSARLLLPRDFSRLSKYPIIVHV